jgi:hypothetical protein
MWKINHLRWNVCVVFQPLGCSLARKRPPRRGCKNPRRLSPPAPSRFQAHNQILARFKKRQKPTVGFQATFFVITPPGGNSGGTTACANQNHDFFWPKPPFFCQTGSFQGHF